MPGGMNDDMVPCCGSIGTIEGVGPGDSVTISFQEGQIHRFHVPTLAALGATDPSTTVMDVLRAKHPPAEPLPDSPGVLRGHETPPSEAELRVFFSA